MLVDATGRLIASQHDDVLDTPMLVGSIMKLVTLVAARASGVADEATRIDCGRLLRLDGRTLDCVHAPPGHALDAREAIAQSCNTYFVTVARRLSRSALSEAAVSLGLPPVPEQASLPLAAIGLDGARASPRRWLTAIRRLVAQEQTRRGTSAVLDGMRDAARVGSAASLAEQGIDVFAKTGTAPMPGGGTAGLVVVIAPRTNRAVIVVAPGASGHDAAEIAGRVLRNDVRQLNAAGTACGSASRTTPATT